MTDNVYTDITKRAMALQQKAIPTAQVYPYYMTNDARFPYWTNRLGGTNNEFNSEDRFDETRTIQMRLVIGHITSGYAGEKEDVLGGYIDAVYTKFLDLEAQMLVDGTTYTTPPTYLHPLGTDLAGGADTGLAFFEAPWMGAVYEVGVEFTLTVYLCRSVTKA